jgi:hypothetical protein
MDLPPLESMEVVGAALLPYSPAGLRSVPSISRWGEAPCKEPDVVDSPTATLAATTQVARMSREERAPPHHLQHQQQEHQERTKLLTTFHPTTMARATMV